MEKNANIKKVQSQLSSFQGENIGEKYQTWNFGFIYVKRTISETNI